MGSRPEQEVVTMSLPGILNSITILLLTSSSILLLAMSSRAMAQDDPYPACFQFFSTWNQATIGIHSDIASAQSCQLLCVETEDCVAFSWHFGSDQFDENTCQLFSEIGEETSGCADCVSGPKSCTCSSDVSCSVDAEYLVHLQLEVSLEEECQDLCVAEPDCSWYSWYSSAGDPFQNTCALLSKCVDRQEVSDGSIKSGRAICNNLMRFPLLKFPECTPIILQTGRVARGTDSQEELEAGWQKLGLAQNTAARPAQVTYLTGTPLCLKGSCLEQFTSSVRATPSTTPSPSRSSTVATTMFTTFLIRPTVMRASVVSNEISKSV